MGDLVSLDARRKKQITHNNEDLGPMLGGFLALKHLSPSITYILTLNSPAVRDLTVLFFCDDLSMIDHLDIEKEPGGREEEEANLIFFEITLKKAVDTHMIYSFSESNLIKCILCVNRFDFESAHQAHLFYEYPGPCAPIE